MIGGAGAGAGAGGGGLAPPPLSAAEMGTLEWALPPRGEAADGFPDSAAVLPLLLRVAAMQLTTSGHEIAAMGPPKGRGANSSFSAAAEVNAKAYRLRYHSLVNRLLDQK